MSDLAAATDEKDIAWLNERIPEIVSEWQKALMDYNEAKAVIDMQNADKKAREDAEKEAETLRKAKEAKEKANRDAALKDFDA